MDKYLIKKAEIDAMPGLDKTHFLNPGARRINKSLGDLTGLTGIGFHIIELPPNSESTEYHVHYFEDECVYILSGQGKVIIDDQEYDISEGDFIGYRAGGLPHTMINSGQDILRCIVAGQRVAHDMADYPKQNKRIYRNIGHAADLVDLSQVAHPTIGQKK
ncbi:cupin domain-containing protein [Gynuella sp.]|uniref:cupin domain-containing protein n=1 Tax=Gynuella sp. TaxID=2969146 RepID=UPI003D1528F4